VLTTSPLRRQRRRLALSRRIATHLAHHESQERWASAPQYVQTVIDWRLFARNGAHI
jgi:hypothetical protein